MAAKVIIVQIPISSFVMQLKDKGVLILPLYNI